MSVWDRVENKRYSEVSFNTQPWQKNTGLIQFETSFFKDQSFMRSYILITENLIRHHDRRKEE